MALSTSCLRRCSAMKTDFSACLQLMPVLLSGSQLGPQMIQLLLQYTLLSRSLSAGRCCLQKVMDLRCHASSFLNGGVTLC